MLEAFGERQQALLKLLLQHKTGLTLDELADELGIARSAVRQHVVTLERDGYVVPGELRQTGGRPGRNYVLSDRGVELFPKQYAWFSALILQALRAERGSEGLSAWLRDLAGTVAASLAPRLAGRPEAERLQEALRIMNELAYEAAAEAPDRIVASSCVYHHLATAFPEVCQFDLALLEAMTSRQVAQQACMAQGDGVCRFHLQAPAQT